MPELPSDCKPNEKRCMENETKKESVEIRRNLSEALKSATSLNDISINYNHTLKI